MLKPSKHIILILLIFCIESASTQNIPAFGDSSTIEIGNWNVEWLGKTTSGFGPNNDSLQQELVIKSIIASNVDIWVLCEVADTAVYRKMMNRLTMYSGYLAPYFPEQKTAILFKKSEFKGLYSSLKGTKNKDSFSTLRFPFEAALIPVKKQFIDTLFVLALHLKSNTGNDSQKNAAYYSRVRSAEWINQYIGLNAYRKHMIFAGDWNDDIDISIYNNLPSSLNILKKSPSNYKFLTQYLSDQHIATTTSFTETIDHQLASQSLQNRMVSNTPQVWRLDNYINSYSTNCSDHYPVISSFRNLSSTIKNPFKNALELIPNPCFNWIKIQSVEEILSVNLIDLNGKPSEIQLDENNSFDISGFNSGLYNLQIRTNSGIFYRKLIKE